MSGRAALVTGGARRLGASMVRSLAAQGFDVAVHYGRSVDEAQAAVQEVEAAGARAVALKADLAKEAEVEPLVPRAVEALGRLDLLVNNAAIFEYDHLKDATRLGWDRHMEINLRAPFVLTQAFFRHVTARDGEGSIVNLIDERVLNLTPHFASYTIAKYGLWGLTQHAARALAPRVRVNAIGPGPALKPDGAPEETWRSLCEEQPLRRGTSPEEIAAALRFLVESPSLTGQMLALDGGMHMGWLPPSRRERLT